MPYKYSKCAKPFTQKPCFIKYYNIRIDETHYECIKGGKASGIPLLIVCEEPIQVINMNVKCVEKPTLRMRTNAEWNVH